MKRVILLVCVLFTFCQQSFSQSKSKDIIYLKNGSIIKGIVTEVLPNENVKVVTADGSLFVYSMAEVDKITKDESSSVTNGTVFKGALFNKDMAVSGYRGFVSAGYTIGTGDLNINRFEITTSHGYQVNPYFFIGAGLGAHIYHSDGETSTAIPLFADMRLNFIQGPVQPTFGFKVGYSLNASDGMEGIGAYVAPSIGARFLMDNGKAFHVGLGYTVQMMDAYYYYYTEKVNVGGLTLKVEFEF